jgi:predicted amino acid-binding ACT domain protein
MDAEKQCEIVYEVENLNDNANIILFSVTVHYIDENFQRRSQVIACVPTSGSKTGASIAADIKEALSKVGIEIENVHLLVRDAAANMIKASKIAGLSSIDCMIHKLQLTVKDALKSSKEIIKQAKTMPSLFNRLTKFREDFEKMCSSLGVQSKALIQVSIILYAL